MPVTTLSQKIKNFDLQPYTKFPSLDLFTSVLTLTGGLYYNNITIINDTSRVIRMMLQLGVSLRNITLMTTEVSFKLLVSSSMLLENIYSSGVTHDDHHLRSSYFYSTGQRSPMKQRTFLFCCWKNFEYEYLSVSPCHRSSR